MKNKLAITMTIAFVALLLLAGGVTAQSLSPEVPETAPLGSAFTYQGRLSEENNPADGDYDFRFILYDDGIGGTQIGSTLGVGDQPVNEGYFTVMLDLGTSVFTGQARWLEVAVRPGSSTGEYDVLSPRQALTAAPYAMYSLNAPWSGIIGMPAGFADGVDNDYSTHDHFGEAWISDVNYYGLWIDNTANDSNGLISRATRFGIWGEGGDIGVLGATFGSYIILPADTRIGVMGFSDDDDTGIGVYGHGESYGGYFKSNSDHGVYGLTNGDWSYISGVYGEATEDHANGVTGWNTAAGVGVYGFSETGYAGYFDGPVHITGNLSKGGGGFKIDHPLNPENQYLSHSFVESPDMKNVYDGVVVLDANGEAWVELPAYFETLNKDFRYQLTAIGAPAPGLYVAQEIEDNRFQIAGGLPDLKVSWQVTGIRHDPYAEAHPIQVEEDKTEQELGKYLHPVELGQPAILGLESLRLEPATDMMLAERE